MELHEAGTPAFVIDLPVARRNAARMLERARNSQVRLRPHVKTHKTVEGARLQLGEQAGPITVSTLAEAHFFRQRGFDDMIYAVPLAPDKLPEIASLQSEMATVHVLLDHPQTLQALSQFARKREVAFSVFLKVDSGYHRAGLDPKNRHSIQLARQVSQDPLLHFAGVLTHAGQSYQARGRQEIKAIAERERAEMVTFAECLRREGINCPTVSVGSTPTCCQASNWKGVDEIRPGNYLFLDKYQVDIGNCRPKDCAATVLTQVVGIYPERRQLVVDAGALALSKDPGASDASGQTAYGCVLGDPGLTVSSLSQEHGVLHARSLSHLRRYSIGSRLQIVPNHACLAAALFGEYLIVEAGRVVDVWKPARGW